MSDPKLISPLLDGFTLGSPISSHDGVACYPAIKENSNKKYIVKIITIPASQTQMDALLLAGAYKDPADAMAYYSVIGEEVMKEAELLTTLSKLDGFLPYEGWQMEPITKRRLGYEVYLVGSYKRSLEKYVRRNPVTHLEAVNLALDMCAALAVCRQAGALYVDLKPNNIFMSDKKEYRIGDLGFISMDALSYTTLPDKYRSQYTPPELFDPMAPMNLTVDTYAVGMILYQLYNEGRLPFLDKAPDEGLPSPANADYELAEIIMKAIHIDPLQRWKDPQEMGRALVDYMQRNSVNDVPITPHTPLVPPVVETPSLQAEDIASTDSVLATDSAPDAEPVPVEAQPEPGMTAVSEPQNQPETISEHEDPCEPARSILIPSAVITDTSEPGPDVFAEATTEDIVPDEPVDETSPGEEDADSLLPHEMSDELSRIIAKADDLLTHEIPDELLVPDTPVPDNPFDFVAVNPEDVDDSDIPLDPIMEDTLPEVSVKKTRKTFASDSGKKLAKKIFSILTLIVILSGIAAGLFWGYQNYYLKTIESLTITGDRHQLTVSIETSVDESLLKVTCSDNYGNMLTENVTNGNAVFTDLLPNTMYKIEVEIDGFHSLAGQTSNVFTTDSTTNIVSFSAVTGSEDGSVLLNFTVNGDEPDMWTLVYSADGEEEQRKNFDDHSISLSGLSIGKLYTFRLEAGDGTPLSGESSLSYMASRLILAQNMRVDSQNGSEITVSWNAPGDIVVDTWTVRCYNTNGYEEQLTVSDTQAHFANINTSANYTIEVTASGMTQPARISITANPVTITDIKVDDSDPDSLQVNWEYSGNTPDGGWLLMYTIDGVESAKSVVKSEESSAVITPRLPDADYRFSIQAADSTTVYGGSHTYASPSASDFADNGISASEITGSMVKTPDEDQWTIDSIGFDSIDTSFSAGTPISAVLKASTSFYLPGTPMQIMFVIRDGQDNILSDLTGHTEDTWRNIWYPGDSQYAELDLPKIPSHAGDYSVTLYFDGSKVVTIPFSITD